MRGWAAAAIVGVCLFLAGLLCARLPAFDIGRQLDAGDILGTFTTIVVALGLGVFFHRTFIEARAEKDLLLAQVREIQAAARLARDALLRAYHEGVSPARDAEIVAALRLLSISISSLDEVCQECRLDSCGAIERIMRLNRDYRLNLLERAWTANNYTPAEYGAAEANFARIQAALLKLMVRINRA